MRILVVGAGAMGCLFGGRLHAAGGGVDVLLVDVWRAHVDAINQNGLVIESEGQRQIVQVQACMPAEVAPEVTADLVLVFTKAFQTEKALDGIAPHIGPQTHIMSLQNGIGHIDVIERFVNRERIIHGITTYPCDIVGPGQIRTSGEGVVKIMSLAGQSNSILVRINGALKASGMQCEISPDVYVTIWEKLAFNAALNAVTAVLKMNVGLIGDSVEGRELTSEIIDEILSVAKKKGLAVDPKRVKATVALAFEKHRDHYPSMAQDILAKRKTEIDAINGAAIHEARQYGLKLPVNETVQRLVKIIENTTLSVSA